jgi:hypothetical protein
MYCLTSWPFETSVFKHVVAIYNGECSSVGRVPDCDSGCRGFEPHHSPHYSLSKSDIGTRAYKSQVS